MLFEFQYVTVLHRFKEALDQIDWKVEKGEVWAIMGTNGSGKSLLLKVLQGEVPCFKGQVNIQETLLEKTEAVSLELQKSLIIREEKLDESEYMDGKADPGTSARAFLYVSKGMECLFEALVLKLKMQSILDRGIKYLSTGEIRKVMICKALLKQPELLLLDEPFDGLDYRSRDELKLLLDKLLADKKMSALMIVNRKEELPDTVSYLLLLDQGKIIEKGSRERVLNSDSFRSLFETNLVKKSDALKKEWLVTDDEPDILIEMKNVDVAYGSHVVLDQFNWSVRKGEHWAIVGPNGAGKSTLLNLISGDNPKAFGNNISLFGIKKGSGESVWDIKKKIGIVSSRFQLVYREKLKVLQVVLSGFYDSIGLYQNAGSKQKEIALKWLDLFELGSLADKFYQDLSYGQQRMVLLARAMVKNPVLLMLDEPCQGLDYLNTKAVLDIVDKIAFSSHTTILYVSHIKEHELNCIQKVLEFEFSESDKFKVREYKK